MKASSRTEVFCGAVCVVAAATFHAPAGAQEDAVSELAPTVVTGRAPLTADGLIDLDTPIATGSRLGLSARETPATVTVIDRSTIEERGAQNTQEILRSIPGVTAHDAPGSVGVSYRGFAGGSISQLFNGINVQYSIAARPVDSWIYDRVEAIGGPSSFLFGAGAVGGTINYVTKLAERGDFTEGRLRLGSYGLREASVGLNRHVWGDGTGGNNHYFRIDVNHRDADSWVDGTDSRATQLATSLLSDLGGGVRHTLAYEYQQEDVKRPYWGTPLLNPVAGRARIDDGVRFKNYNSEDGYYGQRVHWLRSITEWQASDALQLSNTFYLYNARRDYRNVETYRYTQDNSAVIRSDALLQRHDQRLYGNRIEGQYSGSFLGRRSDWSFGADFSINKQTRFPTSLSSEISTVDPYDFDTEYFYDIPGMTRGYQPDRDNKVTTTALYLENRTFLVPDVQLVTALRHERIRLDLTNRREVTTANPASYRRDYAPTTGRVALLWNVTPDLNAYVQYATAADPPSGILSTANFSDVRNNSELTSGSQAEIGAKLDFWEGKGNATLAFYHIKRKNIATQDPNNSALTVQVGEQSSRGVALGIGLQPTPWFSLQGNLSYVDAQYDDFVQGGVSLAGKTPSNTPSVVGNLWASYAFTPEVQGSVGLRHVGRVFADAANTVYWPSYTLVDLALAWQIDPRLRLVGRVRNLTDKVYAANINTGQAYLGAPRTVDLALQIQF
ncbi:TonB-dependent receptor [Allopusillimonas ginsengisoli]|uniref:TonB-dependent receptor n=1 Tax=Allopusillimonas ginsengisoli TaxID=453575 RepID=UPI001AD9E0E7|nr:TonB-dependent siderophore receptor [Allopusillimonas ginsengisoli]